MIRNLLLLCKQFKPSFQQRASIRSIKSSVHKPISKREREGERINQNDNNSVRRKIERIQKVHERFPRAVVSRRVQFIALAGALCAPWTRKRIESTVDDSFATGRWGYANNWQAREGAPLHSTSHYVITSHPFARVVKRGMEGNLQRGKPTCN